MTTLIQALTNHRWAAGASALILALGIGSFSGRVSVDNSLEVWFVEDDPALVSYRAFLEEFGNDEVIVSALRSDRPALQKDRLERLKRISDLLQADPDVERVLSLATLKLVRAASGEQDARLLPALWHPVTEDQSRSLEAAIENGRIASSLVGEDGQTLIVYTWLKASPDMDRQRAAILERVRTLFDETMMGSGEEVYHAGMGVIYDALNQATFSEGFLFIGLSYLVIVAALFVVTGRVLWTVLALLVITLTDIALVGIMGLMNRPMTMITMAIPALVMILGVANVVHMATRLEAMPSAYRRSRPFVLSALAAVAVPCLFNALTTAGGFLSLGTAGMAITRDYGLFAAAGVVLAFVFSLVGMSIALPGLRTGRAPSRFRERLAGFAERVILGACAHRRPVLGGVLVAVVLMAWGISRIEVDTNSLDFLPAGHTFRTHSALIEEHAGPYMPLEFVLTTAPGAWKDAGFLRCLHQAQTVLEGESGFGRTTSIADPIMDVGTMVAPGQEKPFWAGISTQDLQPVVEVLEVDPAALDYFVSADRKQVRVMSFVPMASAASLMETARRGQAILQVELGDAARVEASGYLPLYGQMIAHLLSDQISSLALAFAVIFLLIALILRSGYLSLVAMVLNLLPVGAVLGFMGAAGIRLDIATVTISAALLGIVVDDTVHLLYHLRRALNEHDTLERALRDVARHSGLAVISTSVIFCMGFGVIALASLKSVAYVGLLTSLGIGAALVTDLVVMPALLASRRQAIIHNRQQPERG